MATGILKFFNWLPALYLALSLSGCHSRPVNLLGDQLTYVGETADAYEILAAQTTINSVDGLPHVIGKWTLRLPKQNFTISPQVAKGDRVFLKNGNLLERVATETLEIATDKAGNLILRPIGNPAKTSR